MKTKEELNAIKEEVETLNRKLAGLNEEELSQVTGGVNQADLAAAGRLLEEANSELELQYVNSAPRICGRIDDIRYLFSPARQAFLNGDIFLAREKLGPAVNECRMLMRRFSGLPLGWFLELATQAYDMILKL